MVSFFSDFELIICLDIVSMSRYRVLHNSQIGALISQCEPRYIN